MSACLSLPVCVQVLKTNMRHINNMYNLYEDINGLTLMTTLSIFTLDSGVNEVKKIFQ